MKIYRLLKFASILRNPRVRLLGLWLMYVLRRRCIGVYVDSVYACNYRCRMCYFSDEAERKTRRGKLTADDLEAMGKALLPHALKLQIGCGAEPTMDYEGMKRLIEMGKRYGVPYISITTNGALLNKSLLIDMVSSGLDEITLSLHGIREETYEFMMGANGKHGHFRELVRQIEEAKKEYPNFRLRINYTMNADNVLELKEWDTLFGGIDVNVVQLRVGQRIGNSAYSNFDLADVRKAMPQVVVPLVERLRAKGVTVIAPEVNNLDRIVEGADEDNATALFNTFAYCNVSPTNHWQDDFDYHKETFVDYCQRHKIGRLLLRVALNPNLKPDIENSFLMKPANYKL
ncbi:MAG: radical SAM protein [Paludibacteraceae bacterium]|nr:radical SAM protein [Paludibacteraceae bacterium]